jgi:hypothetical protein
MFAWGKLFRRHRLVAPPFEADLKIRARHINRALERERTRADRSHHPLSMVLLGYDGRSRNGVDAQVIVTAMQARARLTDEVGWFDGRTGFAILPDTCAAGARHFAEAVRRRLRNKLGVRTSFAIYAYAPPGVAAPPRDDQDQRGGGMHRVDEVKPVRPSIPSRAPRSAEPELVNAIVSHHGLRRNGTHHLEPALSFGLPWWKRTTDVVVAGSALLVIWPVLVAIALAIRLDSPGPAIFKQKRAGLAGRPFHIWKFRTMCDHAENKRDALLHINEQDGPAFKIKNDPRITRIGAILRQTSMDELPQLINILRGEMSRTPASPGSAAD